MNAVFRRALFQILKNQLVLMTTVFDIVMALSRTVEPSVHDDMRRNAYDMAAQYTPTDERIKELQGGNK